MHVNILIDLANTNVFRGVHKPNPAIIASRFDSFLDAVASAAGQLADNEFFEFKVRVYDGWFYEDGSGTDLYEMLRRHVRSHYPVRRRGYRLFVDIAEGLACSPAEHLWNTFRITPGIVRYHVGFSEKSKLSCGNPVACGFDALKSWIKGRCSGTNCDVSAEDAAHFRQQKLVDTAIVADLAWFGSDGANIVVVSDDEDVIPGLLTARALGASITWAGQSAAPREPYAQILARKNIGYLKC